MGGKAWAIGSKTRWLWFREQDRAARGGETARRRRCSSPSRGQKVLAADLNLDAALETKRIIDSAGSICMAVAGNVSRADDVAEIVDACIAAFGRIDVLHNNVGIVEVGGPVETSEESRDRVNDVNLKSMFLTCKQVLQNMQRQGN
jgi:NAD(P)-dependent dehydrogenase (short-subunit alcohol dehydrogenase family)